MSARAPQSLNTASHVVYRIAPGLLLVFKPRGHREAPHAHPHRQRLRILRGKLRIESARGSVTLTPSARAYSLAAGRQHATTALADTWLIAEALAAPSAQPVSRRRA
ncbi:MAG: hypothetical protein ABI629_20505 [bacterium]